MKRIRQLIAFFLSAVLLLSVLPVGALAAEDSAASPSVSQAEEAGTPSENTEDSPAPTEDTDSAEEAQPTDDTSDESTPAETGGTEETEASVTEDSTAEDNFSQARFLEEYAAAASYTLDQSLVLTSDLTLDHEIRTQFPFLRAAELWRELSWQGQMLRQNWMQQIMSFNPILSLPSQLTIIETGPTEIPVGRPCLSEQVVKP